MLEGSFRQKGLVRGAQVRRKGRLKEATITLKHTSKRKISSGLLVCLLYSLLDFPKGFLNTV